MFHSNGVTAGVLFEGIVWDGAGKAEIGVNHCSSTAYESHVTHRNEAFINMKAGIVTSYSQYFKYKNATAEVLFDNCLFVNDGVGVGFGSYNALDNTVINCGFYYCGRGIFKIRRQCLCASLRLSWEAWIPTSGRMSATVPRPAALRWAPSDSFTPGEACS